MSMEFISWMASSAAALWELPYTALSPLVTKAKPTLTSFPVPPGIEAVGESAAAGAVVSVAAGAGAATVSVGTVVGTLAASGPHAEISSSPTKNADSEIKRTRFDMVNLLLMLEEPER